MPHPLFPLQRALNGASNLRNDARQDAFNDHYSQCLETDGWINKEVISSFPGSSTTRDELKDAEVGLVRAKEEYKRLQSEVIRSLIMVSDFCAQEINLLL